MVKQKQGRDLNKWKSNRPEPSKGCVRIIGGKFRGNNLLYSGDKVTRPMKDSVREALFNLVGGYLENTIAIDLFAGTGVVGLEAISRGAIHALFLIERHVPTNKIIQDNVKSLDLYEETSVIGSDTFFWGREFKKAYEQYESGTEKNVVTFDAKGVDFVGHPWSVFCCPPYELYLRKKEELLNLIAFLVEKCPVGSLVVVESDSRFDQTELPQSENWQIRTYSPAVIAVYKKVEQPDVVDSE